MPAYLVTNNKKQEIGEDSFNMMWELMLKEDEYIKQRIANRTPTASPAESEEQPPRWKDDRRAYHNNYYKHKLAKTYVCDECGRTLSNCSNIAKHKKTLICQRNRNKNV